jgi:hypothetical protein
MIRSPEGLGRDQMTPDWDRLAGLYRRPKLPALSPIVARSSNQRPQALPPASGTHRADEA